MKKMNSKESFLAQIIDRSYGRKKDLWSNNIILFLALFILIFLVPATSNSRELLMSIALGVVVIAGIFATDYRKNVFVILFLLGTGVLIAMVLDFLFPQARFISIIAYILTILSLIFSTIALVAHVGRSEKADRSTILSAINSYLLIGLTGSLLLFTVDLILPESFLALEAGAGNLNDFIYFGIVTLTTLGYGDISPEGYLARAMATFIALAGQLYLVIIMALIIGKYLSSKNDPS
jgi:voltage-gated potassium channel